MTIDIGGSVSRTDETYFSTSVRVKASHFEGSFSKASTKATTSPRSFKAVAAEEPAVAEVGHIALRILGTGNGGVEVLQIVSRMLTGFVWRSRRVERVIHGSGLVCFS